MTNGTSTSAPSSILEQQISKIKSFFPSGIGCLLTRETNSDNLKIFIL